MKRKKLLASLLTAMLVSSALVGCGSSTDKNADDSKSGEPQHLVVWSHLSEPEVGVLDTVAQEWAEETGNTVEVVYDDGDFQAYLQAANSSAGPDIMYGIAHDNLGTFQKAGLLSKVPDGIINNSDYVDTAIKACTYSDGQYAVPISIETYGLFYNKDKVTTLPKSADELISMGKELGFQYDVNNFYFSYAFLAANGGYVFKADENGGLDPTDIGLGNDGAKAGYKYIQDMVQTDKLMAADISGDTATAAFQDGQSAFYISGPWSVGGFQDAGVNFGVAPLPNMPSFVGVQAAFVSAKSEKQEAAWDLVKYLQENNSEVVAKGSRIPALTSELDKDEYKNNEIVQAFVEQVKQGTPMPNIPEMSAVWGPGGNNLALLTQGNETPDEAAKNVVDQINEGIAALQ